MTGKELEEFGEFWLPADFLSDDFFVQKSSSPGESVAESENEEESVGRLSQQMDSLGLNPKASVMATSPQSTLCGMGRWSFSSNGNPEGGSSQVSSPPSTPLPQPRRDESLDLLYAYAGQVARLEMNHGIVHQHGSIFCKNQNMVGLQSSESAPIIQQKLQAARFYELKRQLLMKQQWAASAARHIDETGPLVLSKSAWPPLQKHHHHQPPFLNGARRESKGTGVFLPRRAKTQAQPEPRKKPAAPPVMLPGTVVQALNPNVDDVTSQPRVPGAFLLDQEILRAMGNSMSAQGKRCPRSTVASAHDLRLPTEWTYCSW